MKIEPGGGTKVILKGKTVSTAFESLMFHQIGVKATGNN